jgi:polyisoprenoid-binding protein YceI
MKHARLIPASLLLLGMTALVAHAEPVAYRMDRNHSSAAFSIRHIFSKVYGHFREMEGNIQYDEQNIANSSADITIKTSSIDTNNENRDKDLRSEHFFNADSFPTITFKSTKVIPGADKEHFQLVGDLNMRGVSRPVTLDVAFSRRRALRHGRQVDGQEGRLGSQDHDQPQGLGHQLEPDARPGWHPARRRCRHHDRGRGRMAASGHRGRQAGRRREPAPTKK